MRPITACMQPSNLDMSESETFDQPKRWYARAAEEPPSSPALLPPRAAP
jgi:hypothetical protein